MIIRFQDICAAVALAGFAISFMIWAEYLGGAI